MVTVMSRTLSTYVLPVHMSNSAVGRLENNILAPSDSGFYLIAN